MQQDKTCAVQHKLCESNKILDKHCSPHICTHLGLIVWLPAEHWVY